MSDRKTDIVFGVFASEKYRRWWWANFSKPVDQQRLRNEWAPALTRFSNREIREGLASWQALHPETDPPTPERFVAFLKPVHTPASKSGLAAIKSILGV